MKFTIQSQEVNNNWYHKPDLKISDIYSFLNDKITSIHIAVDNKGYSLKTITGYTIDVIEVNNLEELMQLIDTFDCSVVVDRYSEKSVEYNQYDIKGKIVIYDDYLED